MTRSPDQNPVDLRRYNEIGLGQPIDRVCPERDLHLTPAQHDVGVMSLLFSHGAHAIDKIERRFEVRKLVIPHQVMFVDDVPLRKLRQLPVHVGECFPLKRRNTPAAGNASFIGEASQKCTPTHS